MIKELRQARGMTQQELADKAGLHLTAIQKLEAGKATIENTRLQNAFAIADALGVPIEKLMKPKK